MVCFVGVYFVGLVGCFTYLWVLMFGLWFAFSGVLFWVCVVRCFGLCLRFVWVLLFAV